MNVLVMYHSRGGHTRAAAEAIAQAARKQNHEAVVKSMIEIGKNDIQQADAVFVGTWVQGLILFGVKPADADLWVPSLPSLAGKSVGVFCTYVFNPKGSLQKLGDMLAARGAQIRGQQAFHRRHPDAGAEEFVQRIVQAAAA